MTKKKTSKSGRQSGVTTEPSLATETQRTVELELLRSALSRARNDETTRHLANAWKPELQSALKNDVYDADELKETIKASILTLTPKMKAADLDAGSRTRLDNDVVAICTAVAFERFATKRSESPAGKGPTEREIRKLAKLSASLVQHIEGMHQSSRELVEETLPIDHILLFRRAAASVAVASKDVMTRLADVQFCEQPTGRKVNKLAESVTRHAAAIFERRTGEKPVRIVDRVTGEAGGQFVEWLDELFSLLKIKASADAEARKYLEWISMETTAKK